MKRLRFLITAVGLLSMVSCGISRKVESSHIERPLRLEESAYEIVGPFRFASARKDFSYDAVLRYVRRKHGDDVDIANLRIDKFKQDGSGYVVNGYVIRYK